MLRKTPHNLTSLIKKKSHAQKEKPSGDLTDFIYKCVLSLNHVAGLNWIIPLYFGIDCTNVSVTTLLRGRSRCVLSLN